MVGVFRRSFSFPNKPAAKPSRHVRSISMPCRSHPLISQLNHQITNLKAWSSSPDSAASAWLCDAFDRLRTLHHHLDDVLNLPQTQDSLRRQPHWVENLLDHFLRFVDVYGIFQTLMLALKEEHSAVQVAVRRKDNQQIAVYMKYRKKMGRQMVKLVSAMQKIKIPERRRTGDVELASMIEEVVGVTTAVSLEVFDRIAETFMARKSWVPWEFARRVEHKGIEELREFMNKKGKEEVKTTMKKMKELEDWIVSIENGSQGVFRSLISARVSLLNAVSQQELEIQQ